MRALAFLIPLAALAALGVAPACSFPEYELPNEDPSERICSDGKTSKVETGVDCGGGCPPCGMGQACREHIHCQSLSCIEGVCQMPTCEDGVKNASEADVDCGGRCAACPPGRDCQGNEDCAEGVCADGFCQRPACDDKVHNGDETGVDCGGSCVASCELGEGCDENQECESNHCTDNVCVAPGCTDGVLNGNESDLDCGGVECGPCMSGERCSSSTDCVSQFCEQQRCAGFSCDDGVLNGLETDLDCGGPSCPGCMDLQLCLEGADCASAVCLRGSCVPSEPTGEALARDGWFAGASHTYPDHHPDMVLDSTGGRWTSNHDQFDGMAFEVDMGKLQTFFTISIRCDEQPTDYPGRFDVYVGATREYGAPALSWRGSPGTTVVKFETAQLARHFKIVLRESKDYWWSINEINVYK